LAESQQLSTNRDVTSGLSCRVNTDTPPVLAFDNCELWWGTDRPTHCPLAVASPSRARNKRFAGLTLQDPKLSSNTPTGGTQVLAVDLKVGQK
jgi:hypothetical protein